ncbi:hypothetical protein DNC80_06040 [Flavobacterium sp. SOK18b]|nr:hypothetical protein [Flavobacterium sp. SOK18b]
MIAPVSLCKYFKGCNIIWNINSGSFNRSSIFKKNNSLFSTYSGNLLQSISTASKNWEKQSIK